jgi:hypothetical protein
MDAQGWVLETLVPPAISRRRHASSPGPPPGLYTRTVVEMATPLHREPNPIQAAFRRCVAVLEDVYRAYAIVTRTYAGPLTVADLGTLSLFLSHANGRWLRTLSVYWIDSNLDDLIARQPSSPRDAANIEIMLTRLREGDPFALYAERRQRAQAGVQGGDFSDAVVDAAISTEILLDAVLSFMLWEERADPAAAATLLAEPLATRIKTAYHPRLGGVWEPARTSVLQAWNNDVMLRRHRVVHRGIRPSEVQAHRALAAARALEEWITGLVIDKRFTYLRTALLMVGIPGLQRRGLWSRRLQQTLAATREAPDDWVTRYLTWRASLPT